MELCLFGDSLSDQTKYELMKRFDSEQGGGAGELGQGEDAARVRGGMRVRVFWAPASVDRAWDGYYVVLKERLLAYYQFLEAEKGWGEEGGGEGGGGEKGGEEGGGGFGGASGYVGGMVHFVERVKHAAIVGTQGFLWERERPGGGGGGGGGGESEEERVVGSGRCGEGPGDVRCGGKRVRAECVDVLRLGTAAWHHSLDRLGPLFKPLWRLYEGSIKALLRRY